MSAKAYCVGRGIRVGIIYLKEVESTQKYLIERVLKKDIYIPTIVWTKNQTDGIGSRNNHWEGGEGNLFLSFVVDINSLPRWICLCGFCVLSNSHIFITGGDYLGY